MDVEYSLSFGPIEVSREELLDALERLLRRIEAWPEGEVLRLSYSPEGVAYSGEAIKGTELDEILAQTADWDGLQVIISYELTISGLMLLNDIAGFTTVMLRVPGIAMHSKRKGTFQAERFFDVVADVLEDLGAEFAMLERSWPGRSRTLEDVEEWLDLVERGEFSHVEWVLMRERGVPFEEVSFLESSEYLLENYDYRNLWVATRWPGFRAKPLE
ncbi:MAG: hypothetical protein H0U74_18960 [Bradymonadaceae bacterium]|nr:hypothetical protein [Lujinxingiaceae bacterium]